MRYLTLFFILFSLSLSWIKTHIAAQFYQDSWLNLVDAIASLVEKDSEFVFDALDGKFEQSNLEKADQDGDGLANGNASKGHDINYRDEPVAFFFVLFGLAFEALVDQSLSASQRLEILQALKRILRPVVSGNAVYQDAVFSETMDTLDRLVLTEGINIQTVIVEIARNLALDHLVAKDGQDRSENLSDDIEQLFELTRTIILVIAGLLPNLGDSTPHARFKVTSDDALVLVRLALTSLVDVAAIFPSIIRHDLNACILHIFSTILATGVCQAEVMPLALPILRRFIQGITRPKQGPGSLAPESLQALSLQIRGCLTRFLTILTIAQRRESETSLPCAKNTLLAITILLTTSSHAIPPQDALIPRTLREFLDCLQDVGLATVAAGCLRSILLSPGPKSPTDEVIVRYLFPRLIAFVVGTPDSDGDIANDPENCRPTIAHALVSYTASSAVPHDALPNAIALIVSTLLVRAKREGKVVYQETAARLLELAKVDQMVFRTLIASMKPEQRALTEEILRSTSVSNTAAQTAGEGTASDAEAQKSAPSIALRMDF